DVCDRREPALVRMPGEGVGRRETRGFWRAGGEPFERAGNALERVLRRSALRGGALARGGRGPLDAFRHGMKSCAPHPYRGAGGPARSQSRAAESAEFARQTQRCNWSADRYSPRRFCRSTSAAPARGAPPECLSTKDSEMFVTPAFAQASSPFGGDSMWVQLLPFVLIFVIMYFLILRPQQKRAKEHQELVKNLRRGDTVITSGGLVGKVTKVVDDDQIEVEIADGVRVRQVRGIVSAVRPTADPANN